MIPACLPPLEPTRPKVPPPPNACDTHAHVLGRRRDCLTPTIAATRRRTRRCKIPGNARDGRFRSRRAGAGQHNMATTIPRCWMRWRASLTACAASR